MSQIAFVVDLDRCLGCQSCRVACQIENETGPEVAWRRVLPLEHGTFPDTRKVHVSIACQHCAFPACLAVCPTDAIFKRPSDGAVLLDPDRCNGCGRCVAACPYGAPKPVPGEGRVSNCDLCTDRRDAGAQPVCVERCLGGALGIAYLEDLPADLPSSLPGLPDPEWTKPSIRFVPPRS